MGVNQEYEASGGRPSANHFAFLEQDARRTHDATDASDLRLLIEPC